jgi:hypothetical protein
MEKPRTPAHPSSPRRISIKVERKVSDVPSKAINFFLSRVGRKRCRGNFLPSTDLAETHRDDFDHEMDKICLSAKKIRPGDVEIAKIE